MARERPINLIPLTPMRFLERTAKVYPDKEAIICGDRRITYIQFDADQKRLANALLSLGVKKGDVVGYLEFNCHRLLEAYYGVVGIGAILLPLNIRLSPSEIAWIIKDAGVRVLLINSDLSPILKERIHELTSLRHVIIMKGVAESQIPGLDYEEFISAPPLASRRPRKIDELDIAELFYTSGTTGTTKGVMMSHRELYLHALYTIASWGMVASDVVLHTIPLFHANGWGMPQGLTAIGGTHVLIGRFDAGAVLELLERERITKLFLVPSMAQMLLDYAGSSPTHLEEMDYFVLGGAPASKELVKEVELNFKVKCIAAYGMTETTPTLTAMTPAISEPVLAKVAPEKRWEVQAKTGLPIVGVDIRVVNERGKEVKHDGKDVGMIRAKSDVLMSGYWKRPGETRKIIDKDGYLKTGDMAVIDENNVISIVDRAKDIVISGGENIASVEVERVILSHAAVKNCAVIGVPDPKWGEVPCAIVVVKHGTKTSAKELIMFCRDRLPHFKCPKHVEFVDDLPYTSVGKVAKRVLREKYWEKYEERAHN